MKTTLVTGGNRGIGLEVCKQLDNIGYRVILGARNPEKGLLAASGLSKNVIVKRLDVTNEQSIIDVSEFIKKEIGSLDLLINNAGLGAVENNTPVNSGVKNIIKTNFKGGFEALKKAKPFLQKVGVLQSDTSGVNVPISDVMEIMDTNFYGPWRMIQKMSPLLSKSTDARIINVSSGMGVLNTLSGKYPAYSLSKSSLNALTIMFSNELRNKNIKVNAVCPGWVKTDMGGTDAPRSVEEGADTIIWLATNNDIPTGRFYRDRKEINW